MFDLLNYKDKLICMTLNIASNLLYKKYGINCPQDEDIAKQANAILWILNSGCTLTNEEVCKIKDFISMTEQIGYSCKPVTTCIQEKGCNLNFTINEVLKECPLIIYNIT